MKSVYAYGNLYWVKLDTNSTYAGEQKYVLMYGSGGINLNAILTQTEILTKYPNGEWFDVATPSNFKH